MKENTTNLYVSSAQIFQSRFIDKSNRWWFVSAKGLTSKYVQSLVSIASSSCNSNAVVKCTLTCMLCICWHVHSFLSTIKRRGKKTFRCQIWTKVIWIVSGYLVFFFLSNFFLSSFVSFECDVECMSKARSLIEDPIEVNRERPFAFGKLWENTKVWDTEQQSQWTVYDAWTFYTCLHVAFIQCRSLLCLILLQKCSECLHKLLASLCSTSLCWLSRCLAYDYLCFG